MTYNQMETLTSLFGHWAGTVPETMSRLTPAGSDREYWRIRAGANTVIGVNGTSAEENRAFITLCRHFHAKGLPVPELLACSEDGMSYLQEDLGDTSLYDFLEPCRKSGMYDTGSVKLLEKVVKLLPEFQFRGAAGLDFQICYPVESFDRRSIMWDLNYFKYCFLKTTGLDFHEGRLEDDFGHLADTLLHDSPYDTFMYRDFQARNIMIRDGEPMFIDFQGGRRGPVGYDLVSLLWQARAAYPEKLRSHLTDIYIEALQRFRPTSSDSFRRELKHMILFRMLQVLGAYGFRGKFERKSQFLTGIPAAIGILESVLDEGTGKNEYPYLAELLRKMAALPEFRQIPASTADRLTVRITSFSFRKGIPEDRTGNGGGFVFDCRSMHNPGLYDEYKPLDGSSPEVISFLDEQGEIQKFMESVYGLTDPAVEKYLSRGFTDLAVCFGCTGGRHRSVRSAECLAEHLHGKYGDRIRIVLTHREMKRQREI